MIHELRPGYTPPNRKQIADIYLPKIYEAEKGKCAEILKDKSVCLSLDGWSNVHNEPIICVTITHNATVYLVDTIDTSGNSHTSDYLTNMAKTSIAKVEDEYGCQVKSIVTDNAANVTRMRNDLEEADCSLITYGCSAHILNLLAHDFEIASVKEHVV